MASSATGVCLKPSPERDNFIRLTRLLIAGGTPILRDVLYKYHNPSSLATAIKKTRLTMNFTKPQKDLIFPSSSGLPKIEEFDVSLLFKLLRNCCGLTEPPTKWNELPDDRDLTLEADIVRIDRCRNEIYAHSLESMALTNSVFEKYWKMIADAMCRIAKKVRNGSDMELQSDILNLRFSPLTDSDNRMVEMHLDDIRLSLVRQDEKLDNIEAKEDKLHQGIEGIQDTILQTALQPTKISDDKPISSTMNTYNTIMNFTINQASPSNSSHLSQRPLPPPGLARHVSEDNTQVHNIQKYMTQRSLSFPSNIRGMTTNRDPVITTEDMDSFMKARDVPFAHDPNAGSYNQGPPKIGSQERYEPLWHQSLNQGSQRPNCRAEYEDGTASTPPHGSGNSAFDFREEWFQVGSLGIKTPPRQTYNPSEIPDLYAFSQGSRYSAETQGLPLNKPPGTPDQYAFSRGSRYSAETQGLPLNKPSGTPDQYAFSRGSRYSAETQGLPLNKPSGTPDQYAFSQGSGYSVETQGPPLNKPSGTPDQYAFSQGSRYSVETQGPPLNKPSGTPDQYAFSQGSGYSVETQGPPLNKPSGTPDQYAFSQGSRYSVETQGLPLNKPSEAANPPSPNQYYNSQYWAYGSQHASNPTNYDDPFLRILVSLRPGLENFHLGNEMMSECLSSVIHNESEVSQFRSYLEGRKLTIKKVDDNFRDRCFICVIPQDLESLEKLWHDYIVQDLREIIKEAVLPEDFGGEVDVDINSNEYDTWCKRLRPREFKDSGRLLSHSQSFIQRTESPTAQDTVPRSKSLVQLPNAQQKALDELFLLVCKNGGKMDWQSAKDWLTKSSYMEIVSPGFREKMAGHFKFLHNNVIQANVRLQFCPKRRKNSNCNDNNCPYLHLCPYYLLEQCAYPSNCINSHDICDNHTNNIFKKENLSSLSEAERLHLLRNIAYVMPEICVYYNTPTRPCNKDTKCTYLHVCKSWVNGDCRFNQCKRAHTFNNDHEQNILSKNNLKKLSEKEILEKLKEFYN